MNFTNIWTEQELQEQLVLWKTAYKKASTGQSYTIGSRTLTRYDLSDIRKQLDYIQGELNKLATNRKPLMQVKARFTR